MAMRSTRRTFVSGAIAAATGLGSLTLLGGCKDGSGLTADAKLGLQPLSNLPNDNSAEVQQWVSAVGKSVRLSNADAGTTGRIRMVDSSPPRQVPGGVREQSFVVYFDLDPTTIPLTEGTYAITGPIKGLTKLFMTVSPNLSAQAVFG